MDSIEVTTAHQDRNDDKSNNYGPPGSSQPLPSPMQDKSSNLVLSGVRDDDSLPDNSDAHGVKVLQDHLEKLNHCNGQPRKNYYLHIHQGQGGLFELPLQHTSLTGRVTTKIEAIGTSTCYTCVGVFIPVGNKNFFAAHIDGHNLDPHKQALKNPVRHQHWVLTDQASGLNLIDRVKKMLREEFKHYFTQHPDCSEGRFPDSTKIGAIVLCPEKVMEHERATGCWIVQAVCEFFGLPSTTTKEAHGFIKQLYDDTISPRTSYLEWPPIESEEPRRKEDADAGMKDDADTDSNASKGYFQEEPHDFAMYAVNGRPWTLCSNKGEWMRMSSYGELVRTNGVE
ncbi:hypothetical protein BST61_g8396 [Cercospora zeina]